MKRTNHRTRRRRLRRFCAAAIAAAALLAPASAALAQYTAKAPQAEKPVFQWIFAVVMVLVCAGLAAMNAKRSHLD